MSTTIYYLDRNVPDDIKDYIRKINNDPDEQREFVTVDDQFGINPKEFLIDADGRRALLIESAYVPRASEPRYVRGRLTPLEIVSAVEMSADSLSVGIAFVERLYT